MQKLIGIAIIGMGITGFIYDWILRYRRRRKRMEELQMFLRKAVYAMEELHIRWIIFFEEYECEDSCMTESIHEVALRLKENRYAKGELAWKEVMEERKEEWDFSKEGFELLCYLGNAFFGKSQNENLELLRLYMKLLSECRENESKDFLEKKKVWIPVGALGGIMLVIILI